MVDQDVVPGRRVDRSSMSGRCARPTPHPTVSPQAACPSRYSSQRSAVSSVLVVRNWPSGSIPEAERGAQAASSRAQCSSVSGLCSALWIPVALGASGKVLQSSGSLAWQCADARESSPRRASRLPRSTIVSSHARPSPRPGGEARDKAPSPFGTERSRAASRQGSERIPPRSRRRQFSP